MCAPGSAEFEVRSHLLRQRLREVSNDASIDPTRVPLLHLKAPLATCARYIQSRKPVHKTSPKCKV